jgi:hypothetical protein
MLFMVQLNNIQSFTSSDRNECLIEKQRVRKLVAKGNKAPMNDSAVMAS